MLKNKTLLILIIIIIVVFGGFIYYKVREKGIPRIKTATIISGLIESTVSAAGVVKAPVFELGSKTGGKIQEIMVKEGQHVSKGKLLVKFDNYEEAKNNFDRISYLFQNNLASEQDYESAKTVLNNSRIISPSAGKVAEVTYEDGETVLPGASVVVIVDEANSWVEAQIDEIDIGSINAGDKVKIMSDVYPDKFFEGQIFWIAPLAELRKVGGRIKVDEESYVFTCKIKFLGNHHEFKTNMNVDVEVVTAKKENVILLPREALVSKDDSSFVFAVKKKRVYQKKVNIGLRSYTHVEVLSGISKDEEVAISNVSKLKDKGRVKVEQ